MQGLAALDFNEQVLQTQKSAFNLMQLKQFEFCQQQCKNSPKSQSMIRISEANRSLKRKNVNNKEMIRLVTYHHNNYK